MPDDMNEEHIEHQLAVVRSDDVLIATKVGFGLSCNLAPTDELFGLLFVETRDADGQEQTLSVGISRNDTLNLVCNILGVAFMFFDEDELMPQVLKGSQAVADSIRRSPFMSRDDSEEPDE